MPIIAVACTQAPASHLDALRARGAHVHLVPCVGNLHSSVIELFIRHGAPGVIAFGCPPRDCVGREGPKWLHERLFNDREAELQPRVDRHRVSTGTMAPGDLNGTIDSYSRFERELALLAPATVEHEVEIDVLCDPVPMEESAT
jgi:coenzyme F420-reducing hydrogenase delta subunit